MQPGSARIEREVRHELAMLPYYGIFDNLAFRVEGNTVTLMGQEQGPTLKASAEQVVRGIEGVDRVNNEIQVLPLSSNDDRIRLDVYRSIDGQAALKQVCPSGRPADPHHREQRERDAGWSGRQRVIKTSRAYRREACLASSSDK